MFKVEHTVKVTITEEDMKSLIIEKLATTHPSIVVDSIDFSQKLKPTRMEVEVIAHAGEDGEVVVADAEIEVEEDQLELFEAEDSQPSKPTRKPKAKKDPEPEPEEAESESEEETEIEIEEDPATAFLAGEESDDEEEEDPFAD